MRALLASDMIESSRSTRRCWRRLLFVGGAAASLLLPAGVSAKMYDLSSDAPLAADGWNLWNESGTQEFAYGYMQVHAIHFDEWLLDPSSNAPWFSATDEQGWAIETRVKILSASGCALYLGAIGPGVWIHDGTTLVQLEFHPDHAGIKYPSEHLVAMDTTNDFHVYRLQNLGKKHMQFWVDGKLALDVPQLDGSGDGTIQLDFGDLGGCSTSESVWDYFEYQTSAASAPGGADGAGGEGNDNFNCAGDGGVGGVGGDNGAGAAGESNVGASGGAGGEGGTTSETPSGGVTFGGNAALNGGTTSAGASSHGGSGGSSLGGSSLGGSSLGGAMSGGTTSHASGGSSLRDPTTAGATMGGSTTSNDHPVDDGCGCAVPGAAQKTSPLWAVLGVLALALVRRRRR